MFAAVTLFMRAMLARSYPRIIQVRRQKMWLVQEVILPVLAVSAFAYTYRAMQAPERYIGFVILGGAMTAFWLNVLWGMGAQLYWERDSGNLELYIQSPAPLMAILAGMALGGMVMTCVRASAILLTGTLLFGVQFDFTHWPLVLAVFLLTMLALYGLGMVFSSVFLMYGREAFHLVNLLQEPVYLLSGMNFPVKTLSTTVATAAAVIPLTTGMDALRQLLFPEMADGLFPVQTEVLMLAVLAFLFIGVAQRLLTWIERKAKQEGKLTVKWQ
jgi:ABC-2 type transport system permease protein